MDYISIITDNDYQRIFYAAGSAAHDAQRKIKIRRFLSPADFRHYFEKTHITDILIIALKSVDLQLTELIKELRITGNDLTKILFCGHASNDIHSYIDENIPDVNDYNALYAAFCRLYIQTERNEHYYLVYDINRKDAVKLKKRDIVYIKQRGCVCEYHMIQGSIYCENGPAAHLLYRLGEEFILTDAFSIANAAHITTVLEASIVLDDNTRLSMSRGNIKPASRAFIKHKLTHCT